MINIDDRLFEVVDQNEYWLLSHITSRLNKKMFCFPSNKTLMNDTGWAEEKLQKVKKSLVEKGLLGVEKWFTDGVQTSNRYVVKTPWIGVYVGADKLSYPPENPAPTPGFSRAPGRGENQGTEVLTSSEVLNTAASPEGEAELFPTKPAVEAGTKRKAPAAKLRAVDPCFAACKAIWLSAFPEVGIPDHAVAGRKINEMLTHIRKYITASNVVPNDQMVTDLFDHVIEYAKKQGHWAAGKPISTFAQQFGSIIHEMKHGKGKSNSDFYNSRNSADRLRGVPAEDF